MAANVSHSAKATPASVLRPRPKAPDAMEIEVPAHRSPENAEKPQAAAARLHPATAAHPTAKKTLENELGGRRERRAEPPSAEPLPAEARAVTPQPSRLAPSVSFPTEGAVSGAHVEATPKARPLRRASADETP
jgi:hypothetical protein